MEPPPAPATTTTTTTAATPPVSLTVSAAVSAAVASYPDSIDSSPRSRATDFEESFPAANGGGGGGKLRLMCSYGGHIVPRPHDKSLCYVGGDTRIVVVDRSTSLPDLLARLSKTLLNNRPFTLKYQLPSEDLDSLITVSSEEDLDNMVDEYDRLVSGSNPARPSRIRLFLFPTKPEGPGSIGSILDGSNRSEDWFLNALNGAAAIQRGFSDPASVNCLLGLEENGANFGNNNNNNNNNSDSNHSKEMIMETAVNQNNEGKLGNKIQSNPDIHSVPDSPIIETTSSFGSTSSSPSLANLPPIRVHVDDGGSGRGLEQQRVVGIEEQFAQMGISVQSSQKHGEEGGFVVLSSPPNTMTPAVVTGVPAGVFSDEERSDHGGVYRKQVASSQPPIGQPVTVMTSQGPPQQKQQMGGSELPSPDSVSSDSSLSNAISRQKPVIYQDPSAAPQMSSGSNRFPANFVDPNTRIQMQQIAETGYTLAPQYDQHQQQLLQQHHLQQQQQLQQQQGQPQPQSQSQQPQAQPQPQQYIPAGAHFVHHPAGAVPLSTYYPMYQPQQPHHHPHHQYQVYYVQAGQPQAYSLPVQQQPNMGEPVNAVPNARPQTPPNPTIITTSSAYNPNRNMNMNVPPPKADMPPPGVYRTAAPGGPQLVQVPSSQSQSQPQPQPQPQPQSQPPPQHQQQQQQQQQQQFVGYSQIHHQSQSIPTNSAANANAGGYAYEYADPTHAQIYYTQPLAPTMTAQYQAVTSGATMVMSDGSSQHPNDNHKQQIRSSQQL